MSASGAPVLAGPFTFTLREDDNLYLCSEQPDAGLYFSDPGDPVSNGSWSGDDNVFCGLVGQAPVMVAVPRI